MNETQFKIIIARVSFDTTYVIIVCFHPLCGNIEERKKKRKRKK